MQNEIGDLRKFVKHITGEEAHIELNYGEDDWEPPSENEEFIGEQVAFLFEGMRGGAVEFKSFEWTDSPDQLEYMHRAIKQVHDKTYRPEHYIVIPGCSKTQIDENLLVVFVGTDFVGNITLSETKKYSPQSVTVVGIAENFESINQTYYVDGWKQKHTSCDWLDQIVSPVDLYKNPTNIQFWDTVPYKENKNTYMGKKLWVSAPDHAMIFAVGKWVPVPFEWLMVNGPELEDGIGEEFLLYKGLHQNQN
ncbi:hypothetical protein D3C78_20370 [compost metagenome]